MTSHDLSWPLTSGLPTYPGDPAVAVRPAATMAEDGYRVCSLSLSSHAGTHVDAPSHLLAEGRTLGSYAVETFRFDAVRVDCTGLDPRATVGRDRLADAAPPADADLLAVHTGWDERFWTPEYRDHPYLSPAAARWCADRGYHVGVDAPSVDPSPGPGGDVDPVFPAHHALLGAERLIVENLRGLAAPPDRFTLHAYPLSVDGDGAPVRAVAAGGRGADADADPDPDAGPERGAPTGDDPGAGADPDPDH